ncbi:MAG: hypothetical protein LBL52_03910 [Rickettsiales bacterium]|jgi:hypothetical protein|nr:hypothetical protein [Rickettsiales bacterium]
MQHRTNKEIHHEREPWFQIAQSSMTDTELNRLKAMLDKEKATGEISSGAGSSLWS